MYGCSQGMSDVVRLIQVLCCCMLLCSLSPKTKFLLANFLMQGSFGVMTQVDCVKDCTQNGRQGL